MACSLGIHSIGTRATATSATVTLTGVSSGSAILVFVYRTANVAVNSLGDGTNTYTLCQADNTNGGRTMSSFYAQNVSSGNFTITATMASSTTGLQVSAVEIKGAKTSGVLGNVNANSGTGASFSCGSVTPSGAGDFIAGAVVDGSSTFTYTAPFSKLDSNTSDQIDASEYLITTDGSAQNPTFGQSSSGNTCVGQSIVILAAASVTTAVKSSCSASGAIWSWKI